MTVVFLAIISFVAPGPGILSNGTLKVWWESFQGGYLRIALERQASKIRITIETQFNVSAAGTDVKLLGCECVIQEEGGKVVSGPDSLFMPVWPMGGCEKCGEGAKKAPGIQASLQIIELPMSGLQDVTHVIKIRVFVVEGAIVEKPLNWTHTVTRIMNPSGTPLPEPPSPKDTIIDLSSARTVLYCDTIKFSPTSNLGGRSSLGLTVFADVYSTAGPYLSGGTYPCYGQQGYQIVGDQGSATPITHDYWEQVWESPPNIQIDQYTFSVTYGSWMYIGTQYLSAQQGTQQTKSWN